MQLSNKRSARLPPLAATALLAATLLAACKPVTATPATGASSGQGPSYPCAFVANRDVTAYELPQAGAQVFGTVPAGPDPYPISARTADGWLGFEPGVAQAGNIGLARNRWILPDAAVTPSCLDSVPVVTLDQIQADIDKSHE